MTTPAIPTGALEAAGAVVTEKSLKFKNPASLTWDNFEQLAHFLGGIGRAYPWWVGDLLNMAEDVLGEEWSQLEALLPHSPRTCANYKSVAKWVPETRRRDGLSHSVHEAVAYLEPQERDRLLDEAERNGWKRDEMRDARRMITTAAGTEVETENEYCPTCGRPYEK